MKCTPNKLTQEDRELLFKVFDDRLKLMAEMDKISNAKLAEKMDVDISTIQNLFSGRTYRKRRISRDDAWKQINAARENEEV